MTLPPNNRRNIRSAPVDWSIEITCTSSWFMIACIRSFARIVSKAKLSGATWIRTDECGTDPALALP